jgi:tRNA(Arg) A34 adenosine deaminase TadA
MEQMDDPALIERLLDVVELEISPMTAKGVARGNKLFGAAILRKSDWSTVIAETNNETENPLWHGEMHALKRFYELARDDRPKPADCIFLATHEPCSLCLSAITWGGYDNFWYLFSHEDSRDSFNIPHDLRILKEVFRLEPGGYAAENPYWKSHNIVQVIDGLDEPDRARLGQRVEKLAELYAGLSAIYQNNRHLAEGAIPLD